MQKERHGLCIYIPVVCQGYIMPFRTLYGCIYATKRGVILSVLCVGFPKTLNFGRTEVKAPRFFYVSLTRKTKCPRFGCLGGKETKRKVSENTQKKQYNVLSLFSSAGIGELGIKACNMNILLSNELLRNRCALYQENYPETESVCGDIWEMKNVLVKKWKSKKVGNPFLIYATPPCQGMSFNGIGKLMTAVRMGQRPKEDQRNRLIIPTIEIIKALQPKWIILENVPTMKNTIIRTESGEYVNIIDYVHKELSPNYVGEPEIVNCADYGIPQKRESLITILTCSSKGKKYFENNHTLLPQKTHSEFGSNDTLKKWVSLRESIGNLPPLSSKDFENQDKDLHWHMVPIIKKEKFWWIEHTPENETAYNNQ